MADEQNNDYHFITEWRLDATLHEIAAILGAPSDLPRWWPAVYLAVHELAAGDADGVGRTVDLFTKGWLPYTLRWQFRISEVEPGRRVVLDAWGDFVGRGVWTFALEGEQALVTYDWRVRAEKPLLRRFSALLKPVFSANHHWAMRMGEHSLQLELARRRAGTPAELAQIPAPPGPTTAAPLLLIFAGCAVGFVLLHLRRRLVQQS